MADDKGIARSYCEVLKRGTVLYLGHLSLACYLFMKVSDILLNVTGKCIYCMVLRREISCLRVLARNRTIRPEVGLKVHFSYYRRVQQCL